MTDAKILTREDFLSGSSLKKELVDVPELGGSLWLRELPARDLLAFNDRVQELQKEGEELKPHQSLTLMAFLVSRSACDQDGKLLFTEDDVEQLGETKINVLTALSMKVMEMAGLNTRVIQEVETSLQNTQPAGSTEDIDQMESS